MKDFSKAKSGQDNVPSGLKAAWKVWRHCCCRNGFYPLMVAPFITASFLLDLYCTIGCGFITLDVGFDPINEAWSQQKLYFGLFSFQGQVEGVSEKSYMNLFHPECAGYNDLFKEFFVEGDKTWIMSQIMGIISGCAGGVATIVIWLMVISPMPVCFFWPGILLPASLIAFLGSGAKFLFFDIEICRSNLWLPEGNDVTAMSAESCSLGMDGILSIISSTLSLACVLLVCLKAPKRRHFNDDRRFHFSDTPGDLQNLRTHTMEDSADEGSFELDIEAQKSSGSYDKKSAYDLDDISEKGSLESKASKQEPYSRIPLYGRYTSSESVATKSSKKSAKKSSKAKRKLDQESEKLRQADNSIEYTDRDLNKMFNQKTNAVSRPETPPLKTLDVKKHDAQSSSPFANIMKQRNITMFSPAAPSDEGSFMVNPSPGGAPFTNGKENNSPTRQTPKTKRSTPKKKKGSSKKKSSKKTEQTSNKSKKYDEALIQRCVLDLEKSFSEAEQIPGQLESRHFD